MTSWSETTLADAALLRCALEGLPDALVIADTTGVIRLWNAAAERLFGYTRADAEGQSLNLMIPERFRPAHDAGFARAVETGTLRTGTRVLRTRSNHKDGRKLYVDFTFAVLKAPDGRVVGVQALARDATEAHLRQQASNQEKQA
ncbi:PAS domain S-box protein [Ramlibacter alkalitolerans]|jgi:PAS domain S-box-containing protein|uniref:PAS domain S-box protein n=1 Tax=Ramlibacter alkalitolerans TaxID=2039631 RepID=A0ABS1JQP5_9BURK|nr:PAS domain S-box protein [Ramlibacter alkalitolerans]MBL0426567.1 PAS domain S-box protein [Ramlibacter alkalitolerans]